MNTDIVKPNIGELTKAKKTLEKAKELNRKVKVVPMGYSPSWERVGQNSLCSWSYGRKRCSFLLWKMDLLNNF